MARQIGIKSFSVFRNPNFSLKTAVILSRHFQTTRQTFSTVSWTINDFDWLFSHMFSFRITNENFQNLVIIEWLTYWRLVKHIWINVSSLVQAMASYLAQRNYLTSVNSSPPGVDQVKSYYLDQCWPSSLPHLCETRGEDEIGLDTPKQTIIVKCESIHANFIQQNVFENIVNERVNEKSRTQGEFGCRSHV